MQLFNSHLSFSLLMKCCFISNNDIFTKFNSKLHSLCCIHGNSAYISLFHFPILDTLFSKLEFVYIYATLDGKSVVVKREPVYRLYIYYMQLLILPDSTRGNCPPDFHRKYFSSFTFFRRFLFLVFLMSVFRVQLL